MRPPAYVNDVNMRMEISTPRPENVDSLSQRQKKETRNDDLAAKMMLISTGVQVFAPVINPVGGRLIMMTPQALQMVISIVMF